MEAKVQQPQLYVAYPSPANFAPGDRELDVLANVLGDGKSSRLYKRLVYDLKIAQSVSASQQSQLLASSFEITAAPMPGHTLDEMLAVIDEEVAGLQAKPVDAAELERAKNQIEADTVRSLESLLARAERLQAYNYMAGDAGFLTEDLRRYRAVDAAGGAARGAAVSEKGRPRDHHRRSQSRRADHGAGEEVKRLRDPRDAAGDGRRLRHPTRAPRRRRRPPSPPRPARAPSAPNAPVGRVGSRA